MRNLTFLLLLCVGSLSIYAQDVQITGTITPNISASYNGGIWTKTTSSPSNVIGSSYFFDECGNSSTIYSADGRKQRVPYLNLNLSTNNFETKLLNVRDGLVVSVTDSVFVFDSNSINKVLVNNHVFKKINSPVTGKNEFMLNLSNTSDNEFYKSYFLSIEKSKLNPLTQQPMSPDKLVKKEVYFIKNDNEVSVFKMRKRNLLKQLAPHSKLVAKFIADNNLNVKNTFI